jgi:thermitase
VLLVAAALGAVPAAAEGTDDVAADRVVVRLRETASTEARQQAARALGGRIGGVVSDDTFVVELDRPHAKRAAPPAGVLWAAPDAVYEAARRPNDECYASCSGLAGGQTELAGVGAERAWSLTTGSSRVVVAVLDTPADVAHPDLAGKVRRGPSFTDASRERGGCDPRKQAHGTAVAGIVGAHTDNRAGVASLGWATSVTSVGVLDCNGTGLASEIAAGIRWAADNGARVINLSLVGNPHPALEEAIGHATRAGALVVAAAGNEGGTEPRYPAAYPAVVGVGATDNAGRTISAFSNRGSWVDLAAPGEGIFTTSIGGYASFDGTSFSSPLVAAAAALVLGHRPHLDGAAVVRRLAWSAAPLPGAGGAVRWGRLDAGSALAEPRGASYRSVASDGSVFALGEASFRGAASAVALNRPVVGAAATPSNDGYWLVASDGGIFSFGDARFFGSTGGMRLNRPVVGMAATPSGRGYWLVASDGGIFSFGRAPFHGSTGGRPPAAVVGMAATRAGDGYWLATSAGHVLAYGGARAVGGAEGRARAPVVAITPAS